MTREIIDRIQKARDSLRASRLLINEGLPDFARLEQEDDGQITRWLIEKFQPKS